MYHIGMKSAEQVLALINETDLLNLTLDDVQFSVPSALTPEEQPGVEHPANTRVVISPKPNSQLIGEVEISYDRIDLTEFETLADPQGIVVGVPPTHATLLAGFNAHYKSALELVDIDLSVPLPTDFVDDEVIELKASPNSLAYRGSLTIIIEPSSVQLSQLVVNPELVGLTINP
jgi:hypothetical protein